MKRIKLIVAYDGTNYCGWQIQNNGRTIEEVLNEALTALFHEKVAVIGASRTDSGVHSEGNVAVFDTESRMPADKVCFALNQRLPEDIRVLASEEDVYKRQRSMRGLRNWNPERIFRRRRPLNLRKIPRATMYIPTTADTRSAV